MIDGWLQWITSYRKPPTAGLIVRWPMMSCAAKRWRKSYGNILHCWPRAVLNDKERTHKCLKQLSFHFRNMRRSSRGSVCRPWSSTRLRLTSKANRWLHKSCASITTQDFEIKTTLSNAQMSWTITSISQLKATLPGQNSGPIWLLVGRISRLRLSRYHLW